MLEFAISLSPLLAGVGFALMDEASSIPTEIKNIIEGLPTTVEGLTKRLSELKAAQNAPAVKGTEAWYNIGQEAGVVQRELNKVQVQQGIDAAVKAEQAHLNTFTHKDAVHDISAMLGSKEDAAVAGSIRHRMRLHGDKYAKYLNGNMDDATLIKEMKGLLNTGKADKTLAGMIDPILRPTFGLDKEAMEESLRISLGADAQGNNAIAQTLVDDPFKAFQDMYAQAIAPDTQNLPQAKKLHKTLTSLFHERVKHGRSFVSPSAEPLTKRFTASADVITPEALIDYLKAKGFENTGTGKEILEALANKAAANPRAATSSAAFGMSLVNDSKYDYLKIARHGKDPFYMHVSDAMAGEFSHMYRLPGGQGVLMRAMSEGKGQIITPEMYLLRDLANSTDNKISKAAQSRFYQLSAYKGFDFEDVMASKTNPYELEAMKHTVVPTEMLDQNNMFNIRERANTIVRMAKEGKHNLSSGEGTFFQVMEKKGSIQLSPEDVAFLKNAEFGMDLSEGLPIWEAAGLGKVELPTSGTQKKGMTLLDSIVEGEFKNQIQAHYAYTKDKIFATARDGANLMPGTGPKNPATRFRVGHLSADIIEDMSYKGIMMDEAAKLVERGGQLYDFASIRDITDYIETNNLVGRDIKSAAHRIVKKLSSVDALQRAAAMKQIRRDYGAVRNLANHLSGDGHGSVFQSWVKDTYSEFGLPKTYTNVMPEYSILHADEISNEIDSLMDTFDFSDVLDKVGHKDRGAIAGDALEAIVDKLPDTPSQTGGLSYKQQARELAQRIKERGGFTGYLSRPKEVSKYKDIIEGFMSNSSAKTREKAYDLFRRSATKRGKLDRVKFMQNRYMLRNRLVRPGDSVALLESQRSLNVARESGVKLAQVTVRKGAPGANGMNLEVRSFQFHAEHFAKLGITPATGESGKVIAAHDLNRNNYSTIDGSRALRTYVEDIAPIDEHGTQIAETLFDAFTEGGDWDNLTIDALLPEGSAGLPNYKLEELKKSMKMAPDIPGAPYARAWAGTTEHYATMTNLADTRVGTTAHMDFELFNSLSGAGLGDFIPEIISQAEGINLKAPEFTANLIQSVQKGIDTMPNIKEVSADAIADRSVTWHGSDAYQHGYKYKSIIGKEEAKAIEKQAKSLGIDSSIIEAFKERSKIPMFYAPGADTGIRETIGRAMDANMYADVTKADSPLSFVTDVDNSIADIASAEQDLMDALDWAKGGGATGKDRLKSALSSYGRHVNEYLTNAPAQMFGKTGTAREMGTSIKGSTRVGVLRSDLPDHNPSPTKNESRIRDLYTDKGVSQDPVMELNSKQLEELGFDKEAIKKSIKTGKAIEGHAVIVYRDPNTHAALMRVKARTSKDLAQGSARVTMGHTKPAMMDFDADIAAVIGVKHKSAADLEKAFESQRESFERINKSLGEFKESVKFVAAGEGKRHSKIFEQIEEMSNPKSVSKALEAYTSPTGRGNAYFERIKSAVVAEGYSAEKAHEIARNFLLNSRVMPEIAIRKAAAKATIPAATTIGRYLRGAQHAVDASNEKAFEFAEGIRANLQQIPLDAIKHTDLFGGEEGGIGAALEEKSQRFKDIQKHIEGGRFEEAFKAIGSESVYNDTKEGLISNWLVDKKAAEQKAANPAFQATEEWKANVRGGKDFAKEVEANTLNYFDAPEHGNMLSSLKQGYARNTDRYKGTMEALKKVFQKTPNADDILRGGIKLDELHDILPGIGPINLSEVGKAAKIESGVVGKVKGAAQKAGSIFERLGKSKAVAIGALGSVAALGLMGAMQSPENKSALIPPTPEDKANMKAGPTNVPLADQRYYMEPSVNGERGRDQAGGFNVSGRGSYGMDPTNMAQAAQSTFPNHGINVSVQHNPGAGMSTRTLRRIKGY